MRAHHPVFLTMLLMLPMAGMTPPRRRTLLLAALLLASGVAQAQQRLGGTAVVVDSFSQRVAPYVDLFYVLRVGEQDRVTTLDLTIDASRGRALQVIPQALTSVIPAEPSVLTLVAERHYVTELLAMSRPRLRNQGEVPFHPRERATYTIKGSVEPVCCSVWIEDEQGAEVPGTRVSAAKPP
jgi:hypothetical protein